MGAQQVTHKLLADLCASSYDNYTFKEGDVEVLHHETDDAHIYAIRGTEVSRFFSGRGWMDVIRDLAFWSKSTGNTFGHAGFVHGWNIIEDKLLLDYYSRIATGQEKNMVITGHSLGGAIAIVGAYKLKLDRAREVKLSECVTFGAPPCLDLDEMSEDMMIAMLSVTTQYVHVKDHIPHTLWYTDYDHVDSSLVGGKFIMPWFMRRMSKHAISSYQGAVGVWHGRTH